ncbi:related to cocaine esterase [Fusarium fujikuroi]|nr:related to cocaine esterase [Fusarium fujikuroi]
MAIETSPYVVAGIPVLLTPAVPNDSPNAKYNGIKPSVTILHKGHRKSPGFRPFPVDTIWERDITIPMRDGILLRGDVFRPTNSKGLPALIAFSPYGKSGDGFSALNHVEGRAGVPVEKLSGYESFEAPDPAEWTQHGYAVVNVTTRGIQGSEGHHKWHGKAEARDGYDTIEYIAQLPWSDGHTALAGNSWLATNQWFIAAEQPPHLTCILPLEGLSDVYRETLCRDGVPYLPFWSFLGNNLFSNNEREDVISMINKYPLMNDYWEDKRAKANLITVPAYVLASMSTGLHTVGSTRCFEDIPHEKKWLRMNATQEWHDLYRDDTNADLKKFLDFYMKGAENGWEMTPKVRISVIRYNQSPIENVPFNNWPIPETQHRTLWLSHNGALEAAQESVVPGKISYQSDAPALQEDDDPEFVEFSYTFTEKSTMIGPARAVLYMSCSDHDDMDVFVILRKADKDGNILRNYNIPIQDLVGVNDQKDVALINTLQYVGPTGVLRASHRALDPNLSKPHWPAHDHTKETKLQSSEVVKLEIGIWPSAIQFEAGEKLILRVAGHQMTLAEFEPLRGGFKTGNIGRHYLHLDSDNYPSRITVPLVEI